MCSDILISCGNRVSLYQSATNTLMPDIKSGLPLNLTAYSEYVI